MPGFIVNGDRDTQLADGLNPLPSNLEYYYTYTWSIPMMLGESRHVVSLRDVTLPVLTVNKEVAKGAYFDYQYAASVSYSDVQVTWYDSEGLFKLLIEWRRSVFDYAGDGIREAIEYKKDTIINSYLADYSSDSTKLGSREYQQYKLVNSWPSTIKYGDLTYTTSDVKMVSVTLTYDWCEETLSGQAQRFQISGTQR